MSGRGRGRGRGRGPIAPKITDDEGKEIPASEIGPPPLFPKVELPSMPELEAQDQRLRERWRGLNQAYIKSPYHLKADLPKDGLSADIARYSSKYRPENKDSKASLAMVMSLDPYYFPEELYTTKERKASTRAGTVAAQRAYWAAQASNAEEEDPMFARMAKMETELAKRAPEEGDQEDGERKKRKTEDGEVEEDAPVEEDEDDYQDDDDYYQGNVFDDDEGYDDALEDGDDGAVY